MRQFLLILLTSISILNVSVAQTKLNAKSSKITVSGNSTMHKWSSNVTKSTFVGDFTFDGADFKKINSASVKMEVTSIKSHQDSDLMDERTHKTLKSEKFPTISYEYLNTVSSEQKGNETILKVNGKLTIAGVTKPTDLVIRIVPISASEYEIKGSEKLLMSNFGITPPSFLAGTLKVDDEIVVAFDVIAKKIVL